MLRGLVVKAPTMHAFISAFELSSRLPPAPPAAKNEGGSGGAAPPALPPQQFSLEHMLEVLEEALRVPHHRLASEGNLLHWQLRSMLRYGHAAPDVLPPLARSYPTLNVTLSPLRCSCPYPRCRRLPARRLRHNPFWPRPEWPW